MVASARQLPPSAARWLAPSALGRSWLGGWIAQQDPAGIGRRLISAPVSLIRVLFVASIGHASACLSSSGRFASRRFAKAATPQRFAASSSRRRKERRPRTGPSSDHERINAAGSVRRAAAGPDRSCLDPGRDVRGPFVPVLVGPACRDRRVGPADRVGLADGCSFAHLMFDPDRSDSDRSKLRVERLTRHRVLARGRSLFGNNTATIRA